MTDPEGGGKKARGASKTPKVVNLGYLNYLLTKNRTSCTHYLVPADPPAAAAQDDLD